MTSKSSQNAAADLSFSVKQDLGLPEVSDGSLWRVTQVSPMSHGHRHEELEFNLVIAGRAAYLLGDRRYDLRPRTLVWLFPGQGHLLLDKSPDYAMWLGLLKPSLLERISTTPETQILREQDPTGHFCRRMGLEDSRRLEELFAEIVAARDEPARFNAGLGFAALTAWSLFEESTDAPGIEVHPGIERAVRVLSEGGNEDSLETLADKVGLSASHLGRLFREQVGVGLPEFRNRRRLDHFFRLYGTGGRMTILEAAMEAGFGSYPQFHRVFTDRMGSNPAKYFRARHEETGAGRA